MIIDVHTHIFPPDVIADKRRYLGSDTTFAELYGSDDAKLATADDLLAGMTEAGIDLSVAHGFAWSDTRVCREHNDYLLEAQQRGGGRLAAFPGLPLAADWEDIEREARRCAGKGATGFGELRPDNLGFDVAGQEGDRLAALALELDVALLFHVSEPVGHEYAGKLGLGLGAFYSFVSRHPEVRVVGAHLAGGLPFYAHMPEVAKALASVRVDTAAVSFLYNADVYQSLVGMWGPGLVLFGSDYPLLSQARSRRRIEESGLDQDSLSKVLGENASSFLRLQ